jgi:glyceraldehyde-3-phosphate dehydrogenase (NADP+) (phosphorylating)
MTTFAAPNITLKSSICGNVACLKRGKTVKAVAVNTTTEAKVKVAINGFGRIGKLPGVYRIS